MASWWFHVEEVIKDYFYFFAMMMLISRVPCGCDSKLSATKTGGVGVELMTCVVGALAYRVKLYLGQP
jgi:hypothetical protein